MRTSRPARRSPPPPPRRPQPRLRPPHRATQRHRPRPARRRDTAHQDLGVRPGTAMNESNPYGRVDDDGTVYVVTAAGERVVGQWPDGDPAAALEFYCKRYEGLAVEVDLLEQRIRSGALSPEDATTTVANVRASVIGAQAVGDLDSLVARLDALTPVIEERRAA